MVSFPFRMFIRKIKHNLSKIFLHVLTLAIQDYTPTNRPRPTGEMTEGPDGETDGMTDDGMTEDPNGVTGGTTSAPRVITWSFGMSEALECVRPGTSVIFEWSGSNHNVDKVVSAEDYASCSGITDTTGVSGPYTFQK